jgi:Ca2+-binding EF-hand superfamily protein
MARRESAITFLGVRERTFFVGMQLEVFADWVDEGYANAEAIEAAADGFNASARAAGSLQPTIELDAFVEACSPFGIPERGRLQACFHSFDVAGESAVDFREFLFAMSTVVSSEFEDRARLAFAIYDVDGDKTIDANECKLMLKTALGRKAVGFLWLDCGAAALSAQPNDARLDRPSPPSL